MTEEKNALARLFAACWKDETLKARFMSDPKAVLAEYDMPVPDGIDASTLSLSLPETGAGLLLEQRLVPADQPLTIEMRYRSRRRP